VISTHELGGERQRPKSTEIGQVLRLVDLSRFLERCHYTWDPRDHFGTSSVLSNSWTHRRPHQVEGSKDTPTDPEGLGNMQAWRERFDNAIYIAMLMTAVTSRIWAEGLLSLFPLTWYALDF